MITMSALIFFVTLARFYYALNTYYFIKAIGMGLIIFIPGRYLLGRHFSRTIHGNHYVFKKGRQKDRDRVMLLIILGLAVATFYADVIYHAVYKHGWPSTGLGVGLLSLSIDSHIQIAKLEGKLGKKIMMTPKENTTSTNTSINTDRG